MHPCDNCFSSNEKSRKICLCSLKISVKKCYSYSFTKKLIFEKLVVKVSLDQEKNKLCVQRKRCVYQVKIMFLLIPIESLAVSGRITEGIQRLSAPMVTFQDEFIEGLLQGMLNANAAAPPHDLIQVFNREWNNLDDETVITVFSKCDARVSVCYGCSLKFERNRQGPLPPFDFIIVKKLRREYYNQGMKCLAAPSNAYFHAFCDNPFYQPFQCIQCKCLALKITFMKMHNSIIGSLTPQHLAMLRNFQLFQFLYWKDTLKYSRIYWKAQVLEIDFSRFIVFFSFVCLYSWGHFICKVV